MRSLYFLFGLFGYLPLSTGKPILSTAAQLDSAAGPINETAGDTIEYFGDFYIKSSTLAGWDDALSAYYAGNSTTKARSLSPNPQALQKRIFLTLPICWPFENNHGYTENTFGLVSDKSDNHIPGGFSNF